MQVIKILILLFSISVSFFLSERSNLNSNSHLSLSKPEDSVSLIRIAVVGDLMCHSPQFIYATVDKDSFDFNPVFRYIKPYLEYADFTFGNLETVIGKKGEKYLGYPRFKSPQEFLSALANNGFDFLTFANNHTLDQGENGVLNTLKAINEFGFGYSGAFKSFTDRDSIRIIDIKGIKVSILAYSYGTNGSLIPKGKEYLINLIDRDRITSDIYKSRSLGAEVIVVNFHFGNEYQRYPSDFQKEVVNYTIKAGADIITASHPHVIQPVDFYETSNAKLDSGFVAYSLGNFISNQRNRFTDAGVILFISLAKNFRTNEIKINSIEFLPTWVFKGKTERGNEFIILPLKKDFNQDDFNFLKPDDVKKILQAKNDTQEILMHYTTKISYFNAKK